MSPVQRVAKRHINLIDRVRDDRPQPVQPKIKKVA
jgi:hypothetical protein